MVKCLMTYMTKCMADVILKKSQTQNCKFQNTFVNCAANFQNINLSLARELFLHSWLKFHENGSLMLIQTITYGLFFHELCRFSFSCMELG